MTLDEYQRKAARTIRPDLTLMDARRHSLYGLAAEVGELLSIFQKHLQGHPISDEHIIKEGGDILWMLAEFFSTYRISLDDVAATNISKLKARYPNGFETDRSMHRQEGDI